MATSECTGLINHPRRVLNENVGQISEQDQYLKSQLQSVTVTAYPVLIFVGFVLHSQPSEYFELLLRPGNRYPKVSKYRRSLAKGSCTWRLGNRGP